MTEKIKVKSVKKCERCGNEYPYPYRHNCFANDPYMKTAAAKLEAKRRTKTLAVIMALIILGSTTLIADEQLDAELAQQVRWQHSADQLPDFDAIVDAIYIVEGGNKTRFPFGIKSVNCSGYDDCRQVAANTVINNYKRWEKAGRPGEYLDFLADRYCPPSVDKQGNENWKKNMRRILQ